MMYIDRRKNILEAILKEGSVKVNELAAQYAVGEVTIRRDLKYLAQAYDIQQTYGGALAGRHHQNLFMSLMEDLPIRRTQNIEAKKLIAKKAAALVEDDDTIALNCGSTVELVVDDLPDLHRLNLVTLSLPVAVRASLRPFINVYLPGGRLRNYSGSFFGPDTEAFLRKFSVNKAFFGVSAVSIKNGVTHPVLEEASVNKVLYDISMQRYLLTDSTKFDQVSLAKMLDLDGFDCFIADDDFPEAYRKFAEQHNIRIL